MKRTTKVCAQHVNKLHTTFYKAASVERYRKIKVKRNKIHDFICLSSAYSFIFPQ